MLKFFAGKTEGTEFTSCWMRFIGTRTRMTHKPQMRGPHRITKVEKEHKQEILTKTSSRNQRDIGIGGQSYWLRKFIYKK